MKLRDSETSLLKKLVGYCADAVGSHFDIRSIINLLAFDHSEGHMLYPTS